MSINQEYGKVCVVGCGIIGLSTAIVIQQQNPNTHVTIIADKLSPDTTSDGAAGLWEPKLEGGRSHQDNQMSDWILRTGKYLESITQSKESVAASVTILSGYYLSNKQEQLDDCSEKFYGCRKLDAKEMTAFFPNYSNGWLLTSFQVEGRTYRSKSFRFKENGGNLVKRRLNSISEIFGEYDIIVNCAGLGAGKLVNDDSVHPIRGQVIRVKAPWVKHFIIDIDDKYDGSVHIIPCRNTVLVGKSVQKNNWNLKVDKNDRKEIWRSAVNMFPSISHAELDHEWVGLRPGRPTVRLERETINIDGNIVPIVHNYGHGGRGVSMSWGCAEDAAKLVQDIIDEEKQRTIKSKL
ncbi:D-aspartate oxidase-like [Antedon mediterranea]|uniref:D-aspartate oxidase-like n=1 Tax=Antedon mediterranea TaxID=105859 RepID=UPI003AF8FB0A